MKSLAIVLVYYGDYALLHFEACYSTLRDQLRPSDRLYLVDNGASEKSKRLVRQEAPDAVHLDNGGNKGWASANNLAIRDALLHGCDAVILLNMDTTLDRGWLKALIEASETRPETHIFQSKILLHGTDRINSAGNRIHYLGYGFCNGYGLPKESTATWRMDFTSGVSMLVKKEVFETVGLFREEYFLYYDDLEFCWRARLAGFRIGIAEKSVCHHKYDFKSKLHFLYYLERNRLVTLLTLERRLTLALIAPLLILSQIFCAVYFCIRGHALAEWRLLSYFAKAGTWRYIRERRRQVRKLRRVQDSEVVKHFAGKIVFAEIKHPVLSWILNPVLRIYWKMAKQFIV